MAQYFTDFSEYTKDVAPSDWSQPWAAFATAEVRTSRYAGATGDAAFYIASGGANARYLITWDKVDPDVSRADCEVVMRFRHSEGNAHFHTMSRAAGSSGSESGYRLGATTSLTRVIAKYVAGTFTSLSASGDGIGSGAWHWVRSRVSGTDLKIKVWTEPAGEPAGWDLESTDSDISAAGSVGFFQFTGDRSVDMDLFGVGTGGDTAPTSPVSAGPTGPFLRTTGGYLRTASGILRPA